MQRSEIDRHVKGIITDILGHDEEKVADDAMLMDDLGADSLDATEIAVEIEDVFGIEVPDDAPIMQDFGTRVRDVVDYVERAQ